MALKTFSQIKARLIERIKEHERQYLEYPETLHVDEGEYNILKVPENWSLAISDESRNYYPPHASSDYLIFMGVTILPRRADVELSLPPLTSTESSEIIESPCEDQIE